MNKVEIIRENFIKGIKFDESEINSSIYSSWKRSKKYNVDFNSIPKENVVGLHEIDKYIFKKNKNPKLTKFVEIIKCFDFIITIYDGEGQLIYILNYNGNYKEDLKRGIVFLKNASEKFAGTNSTGITIFDKKPSIVIGPEHYNYSFRKFSCVAAPIFNKNKFMGTVNISIPHTNVSNETLNLAISLSKIYESVQNEINENSELTINYLKKANIFYTFDKILTKNKRMNSLINTAKKVSKFESPIIIYGESGVGKEMFAQSIHDFSNRTGEFVPINCGAIPNELLESELFGYEKGSFTGAKTSGKVGLIEYSSNGTLFLDEIESMSLNAQIKLLRIISTGTLIRIGGVKSISVNLRIIAASKLDLLEQCEKGYFREDLYYRLNVVTLNIPSLRERPEDIEYITRAYIEFFSKKMDIQINLIDKDFLDSLNHYNWPGNVRELKNIIERAIIFSDNKKIVMDSLPEKIKLHFYNKKLTNEIFSTISKEFSEDGILENMEIIIIERILKEEKGNISSSARRLGISRPKLYRKIKANNRLENVIKGYKTK